VIGFMTMFEAIKLLAARKSDDLFEIAALTDDIIMSMRAGISFENALIEVNRAHRRFKSLFSENFRTNGQTQIVVEAAEILSHCRQNPSQSYKVLDSFRQNLRLRSKLQRKHLMLSLQAKAQGFVSIFLFASLFLFQLVMVPEFRAFLHLPAGKMIVLACFFLVYLGMRTIFKLGTPGEFQL
jgi:hypothetical protein